MDPLSSDVAYDYIRKRILSGEYPPGSPLATEVLSGEMGMSRTPVRDALRMLHSDGLVTIRSGSIASVTKMTAKEFEEASDLRLALECHAAGRAAIKRTADDLNRIKFALEAMRTLSEQIIAAGPDQPLEGELVKEDREDVRFHIAIISAANNELMKKEILRLHLINRVLCHPNLPTISSGTIGEKQMNDARRRVVLASHEKIYEAIAQSNPAAAKAAMESHLQEIIEASLRNRAQSSAPSTEPELTEDELAYTT